VINCGSGGEGSEKLHLKKVLCPFCSLASMTSSVYGIPYSLTVIGD
jgi:hypothetical protein